MCVCSTRVGLAGSLSPLPTPAPALVSPSHRGKRCEAWSYALIPTTKPGQFTVENKGERGMSGEGTAALGTSPVCSSGSGTGADREDVQVIETDYTNFALVLSLRQTSSLTMTIIRVNLLGRKWRLPHKPIDRFICLARTQNLTKNNFIFPDVTGNGFAAVDDGKGYGIWG